MKKLIYLSGPITGLTYAGATDWRQYAKAKLAPGLCGVDPMRGKAFLETFGEISGLDVYARENVIASGRGITTRDRYDTLRCDAMLLNLLGAKRVSIGSMIELGWADALRRPIVMVMEPEGNVHEHLMVHELIGYRVPTLDEGIHLVNVMFGEDL